jgi:hypothetical protein
MSFILVRCTVSCELPQLRQRSVISFDLETELGTFFSTECKVSTDGLDIELLFKEGKPVAEEAVPRLCNTKL